MRHSLILVIALFVCTMLAGTGAFVFFGQVPGVTGGEVNAPDLDGKQLRLSDYRGKVVLLVFWVNDKDNAEDQAAIKRLQARFAGQPFAVVGVNGDPSKALARKAAERGGYQYPSWYDGPNGPIARRFGVADYPEFVLLDTDGQIAARYDDVLDELDAIQRDIGDLINLARRK
jgi:peroxiredoxin